MSAETIRIEIPIETIDETAQGLSSAIQNMRRLEQTLNNVQRSYDRTEETVTQFDRSQQRTQKSLSQWAREKYEVLLEAKEKISPVLTKIGGSLKSFDGKAWNITMKAKDLATAPIKGILNLLKNPLLQAGAVLGIGFSAVDSVNTYKDFEAAMSQVQAVSGATGGELEKLTEKAKQMGATTKFTAAESAEAFNYMAMAGWKTGDMLEGIEGILSLAAASGESLGTTSDIVTDALTAFGLKAGDAGHFADVLAAASSNANTNVSMLGESFKYCGPIAGALGYSIEDTATALGLMANSGIKASMAGTAMRTMMTNLQGVVEFSGSSFGKWVVETQNADGTMRDLNEIIKDCREAFANMTEAEKSANAEAIAGKVGMSGFLAVMNATEADMKKLSGAIEDCDGASARMADTMLDNLQGSITLLQSALDGVKISFGERLSPYVRSFADWLTGQMPAIQSALDEMMDWVDVKVEQFKDKIGEMTASDDWQDADFLGKVKIAWDEIIAEPFSEWWNTTGKAMLAEKAADFGNAIGTGISTSLLMLLGIDVSDSVNEGVSIGKSFAKGFSEGFDLSAVTSKFTGVLGNMVKSAGKLLPGGESADMSSLFSAFFLSKLAKPVFSVGRGAFDIGRAVMGQETRSAVSSLAGRAIGSFSLDAELASMGTASGSGIAGLLGKLGMGLGSTASTGAGMMAVGGGAAAGTIAAGAALMSGFKDFKVALDKNTDAQKSKVYKTSGAMKVGGVAAGAAAGAAIGSVIPVVGTAAGALIGAGIGGIGGWLAGDSEKKKYEEQMKEQMKLEEEAAFVASKARAATGRSVRAVRIENEALNAALEDSTVSAESFTAMYRSAVSEKVQKGFGSIRLSLKEIKELAGSLVMSGESIEQLNNFVSATEDATASFGNFQGIYSSMSKLNWKSSLGFELDSTDIEEYKTMAESMVQSAKDFIENKHFEATAAFQLIMGDADTSEIISNVDSLYGKIQNELNGLKSQLTTQMDIYMSDGTLSLNEAAEVQNLMTQIKEITDKVSNAETEAAFETLKIKYGGSGMDAESFSQLQQQLQKEVEGLTQTYDEALKVGITNLNLELSEGVINKDEFNEQLKALSDAYDAQIDGLELRVESFQLETIADAFGADLEGILPDIEGTTAEKLSQAIQNAVDAGINPATWDTATAAKYLGLEGLDTVAQDAIIPLVTSVAATMPDKMKEAVENSNIRDAVQIGITNGVKQADNWDEIMALFGDGAGEAAVASVTKSMVGADLSGFDRASQDYATYLDNGIVASLAEIGKVAGEGVSGNISDSVGSHAADTHPGVDLVQADLENYVQSTIGGMNVTVNPTLMVEWNVLAGMPEIHVPAINTYNAGYQSSLNTGKGLIDGAGAMRNTVMKVFEGLGKSTVSAFNKGTDSHSPSREFKKAAKNTTDGVIEGVEENKSVVLEAYEGIAKLSVDRYQEKIMNIAEVTEEYLGLAAEKYGKHSDEAAKAMDFVMGKLDDMSKSYNSNFDSAYQSISGRLGLFTEVKIGSVEASKSVDKMMESFSKQSDYLAAYGSYMAQAMSLGVDEGILGKLSDGSQESAEILKEIVTNGADKIDELNASFAKLDEGKQTFAAVMAELQTYYGSNLDGMVTELEQAVADMQQYDAAYQSATDTCQGIIDGIDDQWDAVVGKYNELTLALSGAFAPIMTGAVTAGAVPAASASSVPGHAVGGFVNGMQLSWVGEEGPEAIIPLVPGRRRRALDLYSQTGKMLGITAHADGGIVGGRFASNQIDFMPNIQNNTDSIFNAPTARNEASEADYYHSDQNSESVSPNVTVTVSVNPNFNITQEQGQDSGSVMDAIIENIGEIADRIGGDIAGKLLAIFGNMA